jgi:hypothetical protein
MKTTYSFTRTAARSLRIVLLLITLLCAAWLFATLAGLHLPGMQRIHDALRDEPVASLTTASAVVAPQPQPAEAQPETLEPELR